jgi:hypothetical protein
MILSYSLENLFTLQGTGSYPCPPHGLQRKSRFMVIHPPFSAPYLFTASAPYWEQEGVYLQDGERSGEMVYWYKRITANNILPAASDNIFFKTL